MSSDPRRGIILDYFGERPCLDPMVLGRLMDRVCNGRTPSLRMRVSKVLAELRKKLAR